MLDTKEGALSFNSSTLVEQRGEKCITTQKGGVARHDLPFESPTLTGLSLMISAGSVSRSVLADVVFSEFSTGGGVAFCGYKTKRLRINNKELIERSKDHMIIIPTREVN